MEYTINKLSKMTGLTTRTLRYYNQIGLLVPKRTSSNGYRIYGQSEIDKLQQILFYRELGFELSDIDKIITAPQFDPSAALENHLKALTEKREQLDTLIENVKKTISAKKGEIIMNDNEKFEGFKQELIDKNEQKYGEEIRKKYGDEKINKSNAMLKGMTKQQYEECENLREQIDRELKAAFESGDPSGDLAQKACELHKKWLCFYYPDYNKEYHKSLGEMYVNDVRFKAYYDRICPGCSEFLKDAINIYCK